MTKLIAEEMEDAGSVAVYLDGEELPFVTEADDVEGYARCIPAEWPADIPARVLDAEDAVTGQMRSFRFATVRNWEAVPALLIENDEGTGLEVIVRGRIEFRRVA
jgi:hypothetical protein